MKKELADMRIFVVYQERCSSVSHGQVSYSVNRLNFFLLAVALLMMNGCARYVRWGRAQFEQITYRPVYERDFDSYVQSIDRYDGFNTVGHFDIIWYARPAMDWFLAQYAGRVGAHSDAWKSLFDAQLREQRERVVFYISLPLSPNSLVSQLSLEHSAVALWSVRLCIDGIEHQPVEIRKVPRPMVELAQMFGSRYDPHYREIYYVAYARGAHDIRDFLASANMVSLVFRSDMYEISATWDPCCLERHRRIEEPLQ